MSRNLLALDGPTPWVDKVLSGDWFGALLDPLVNLVGMPVVASMFGGAVFLGLWSWSQSFVLTATWLALFATIVLARAPPSVALVGWVALALALALGLYGVITGE